MHGLPSVLGESAMRRGTPCEVADSGRRMRADTPRASSTASSAEFGDRPVADAHARP